MRCRLRSPSAGFAQSLLASGLLVAHSPLRLADGVPRSLPRAGRRVLPQLVALLLWRQRAGAARSDSHDITFSGTDTGTNGFGSEIAYGTTLEAGQVRLGDALHRVF